MHKQVIVHRISSDTYDVWPAATESGGAGHGRVEAGGKQLWKGTVSKDGACEVVTEAGSPGDCLHAVIERMLGH